MLRLGYMASDFHPKLLVLGEKAELGRVAQTLSEFAASGRDVRLVRDAGVYAVATDVVLQDVGPGENLGLFDSGSDAHASGDVELTWWLTREHADGFAAQVLGLVNSGNPAGSVTLECGRPDEVKVVVSYGEWDDAFLAT